MADIRCPNCGKNNPDILDVCQFCLTPLKPDSVLRTGEQPTKKNTGELEPILPDWLKDVREQARASAEEESAQAASRAKPPKDELLDLLAGLSSQTGSDEEDVPDWLKNIAPPAETKSEPSSAPTPGEDVFVQFDKSRAKPFEELGQESTPAPASEEKDELSAWFAQAAGQPEETVELEQPSQIDGDWVSPFDTPISGTRETSPREEEDLSWLRNLEESAKQTGDLKAPRLETDREANSEAQPENSQSSAQEDLSWLDSLGGIPEPSQPSFEQTPSSQKDLGWLNQLGGMPAPEPPETPERKTPAQEDLSWLNRLGGESEPVQPFDAAPDGPLAAEPFAPEEDLSWLKNLGAAPESAQPSDAPAADAPPKPISQDDLSWLNQLDTVPPAIQPYDAANLPAPTEEPAWLRDLGEAEGSSSAPPFVESELPGRSDEQREPEPDWLKSTAESPSMAAGGDVSMDWFKEEPADQQPAPAPGMPESAPFADIFSSPGETSDLSTKELDSLFAAEMPDWLSRSEPGVEQPASPQAVTPPPASDDSLAPVELPSWVQAMRPMEALISETAPSTEEQPEEKEGPLAGLRGVIPGAPIGSSTRPKPVSLKLQVSPEQQASAALLEQILGTETNPRALVDSSFIASQHLLRWVLAGLFLLVLGAGITLRSQSMPVPPGLPLEGSSLAGTVLRIPANSKVLVVIDYEPSLAGEMEAIGSPLLNQMISLGRHNLSFIATSPSGTALVERLLTSAGINTADGFGYQAGMNYRNLGFLPGGAAGVLGFVEQPASIVSSVDVGAFSEYAAVVVMTDHAESARVWVEQVQSRKQLDFALTNQPLVMVASAQAGPLLQPYISSGQVNGMIGGLPDAARYEANNGGAGAARLYWDTFGVGLVLAIAAIILGSLWSLFTGIRARRAQAEQG